MIVEDRLEGDVVTVTDFEAPSKGWVRLPNSIVAGIGVGVDGRRTREFPHAAISKPEIGASRAVRWETELAETSVFVELAVGVPTMRILEPDSKTSAPDRIAEAFEVEVNCSSKTAPDFMVTLDTLVPDGASVPL